MSFTIAIAGKGGVGKTTIAGLLVKYLINKKEGPVLAVDADSNANFNEVLGVKVEKTLGEAKEEMKSVSAQSIGLTKNVLIEMRLNQALIEEDGFDLIVMGRTEGAGCYCAANHLLTVCMDNLAKNYNYIVVDNEAGMEHISRVTTKKVDLLLVVSDTSRRSLMSAERIFKLAKEMKILKGESHLIVNMSRKDNKEKVLKLIEKSSLKLAGILPHDDVLEDWDLLGEPTSNLSEKNPVVLECNNIFRMIFS